MRLKMNANKNQNPYRDFIGKWPSYDWMLSFKKSVQ